MKLLFKVLAVAVFSLSSSEAATIHYSSFDSGTEGWSIGGFFASSSSPATDFVPSGGVSGGYLETTDIFGNNAFRAPSSWLGDQSALFGGRLRFFQRAVETDGFVSPVVVLAGAGLRLQYRDMPPGTEWTPYVVDLMAGGWEIGDGSGDPSSRLATDDQIRQVLANLDWIAFYADWHTGPDRVGLDEVMIEGNGENPTEAPEPATVSIVGLGAMAMIAVRRRRK
jgi:hypothetical protein